MFQNRAGFFVLFVVDEFAGVVVLMARIEQFAVCKHCFIDFQVPVRMGESGSRLPVFDLNRRIENSAAWRDGFVDASFPAKMPVRSQNPFAIVGKCRCAVRLESSDVFQHDNVGLRGFA